MKPVSILLLLLLVSLSPASGGILHNWWDNGVYVDYASGNWNEGLTTYLADHAAQGAMANDKLRIDCRSCTGEIVRSV